RGRATAIAQYETALPGLSSCEERPAEWRENCASCHRQYDPAEREFIPAHMKGEARPAQRAGFGTFNRQSHSRNRQLRNDFADYVAVIDVEPLSAGDFELPTVEAELVQHRRMQVGDVVAVLGGVKAKRVGRAVRDAPFDSAAGQPDRKPEWMVI